MVNFASPLKTQTLKSFQPQVPLTIRPLVARPKTPAIGSRSALAMDRSLTFQTVVHL